MRLTWAGVRISTLRVAPTLLSASMLASGCHVLGIGATNGAFGSGSITVAVAPGIDNAPLRVAVQEGLFQRYGMNVTVKAYPSADAEFQALSSDQAQIAVGDYTSFLYEQANGHAPLRLINDAYDAASSSVAILTLPNSGITRPNQLQNESVATPPADLASFNAVPYKFNAALPYNISTLAAEEVLQNDGVSPSSVIWTPVQPQDMIQELSSGHVKAILATEPYILRAEEQLGAVEVVDASSGVTSGLPLSGYFSLNSYAQANPANVAAFQAALAQAQSECAQRGPVQAVLPQLTGMSARDAALVTMGTYPTSVNVGQVQRVATLMYDSGMINNSISISALTAG